ncbi:MAG: hypothetical protein ACHREM_16660 [Polyangiales bacterium]
MTVPQAWSEICSSESYRGRWVALVACRYDEASRPVEGSVIDVDDDVVALCNRIRGSAHRECAILFIDDAPRSGAGRDTSPRGRLAHAKWQ